MLKRKSKQQNGTPARRRAVDSRGASSDASQASSADRYAFRRNRTITGSTSGSINSSAELTAGARSPRAHAHHLTTLRRRVFTYFLAIVAVSFLLYVLVSQLVAATTMQVNGDSSLLTDADELAYTSSLDDYYAARPVERLRFLLNLPELTSHMQAIHPEIQSVVVEAGQGMGEASVSIIVREPVARWSIDGNNRYVDQNGVVFARNYFERPKLQIIDNSGIQATSTKAVASNRFLGFVGRLIAKSNQQQLIVTKVTIPTLTTRQVAVSLKGKPYRFKFSVDRSVDQQVEDMARINRYFTQRGITANYVDIRVEGKAFYQ